MTLEELNAFVRFVLGGLTQQDLSDEILNLIIQGVLDSGIATTDCLEKYYSVKQTLIYLKTSAASDNAGSGVSGDVKKRREKINKREIEIEYDTSGDNGSYSSWASLLEDFLEDPSSYLLCEPFPSGDNSGGSVVIGVTKDKYDPAAPWRKPLYKTRKTWPSCYKDRKRF